MLTQSNDIEAARKLLSAARWVVTLTGAGVSAESGVPTFRGSGSLSSWKGMPFEVISSARMARENLPEVWAWFDYRLGIIGECAPNPAHKVLAAWQTRFETFTLVTQNVDGLHAAAGSQEVLELHGSLRRGRCISCKTRAEMNEILSVKRPPICHQCGSDMRPDVVLFGEMLPQGVYETAERAALSCDLFLLIGTSALVYPAAMLPQVAQASGAKLIEINPEATTLSALADVSLRGKAGEILPLLRDAVSEI